MMKGFAMSRLVLVVFLVFGLFLGIVPPAAPAAHAEEMDDCALPLPELTRVSPTYIHKLMQQATAGDADAQVRLGVRYYDGNGVSKDVQQAVSWWRKAAEQGNATAQYFLGVMYAIEHDVSQDYPQAVNWWRKAAEQGNASAQFSLGAMYARGQGVPQDFQQAAHWWRKAAEQGHEESQYNLGVVYESGEQGIAQDFQQAAHWWRKAAEQGHLMAQGNLAIMYAEGRGVQKDVVLAYALCTIAAADGGREVSFTDSVLAKLNRERAQIFAQVVQNRSLITQQMTPEQIEEGKAIADQWKIGQPFPTERKTGR